MKEIFVFVFEDKSRIYFDKGEFDPFCIYYEYYDENKQKVLRINNLFLLSKIKMLVDGNKDRSNKDRSNKYDMKKMLCNEVYMIDRVDEECKRGLDKIINDYSFEPKDILKKIVYMVLWMYYSEDKYPKTSFGRRIFRDAITRVLKGEDCKTVSELYHGKNYYDIIKLLEENEGTRQSDIESAWG